MNWLVDYFPWNLTILMEVHVVKPMLRMIAEIFDFGRNIQNGRTLFTRFKCFLKIWPSTRQLGLISFLNNCL